MAIVKTILSQHSVVCSDNVQHGNILEISLVTSQHIAEKFEG